MPDKQDTQDTGTPVRQPTKDELSTIASAASDEQQALKERDATLLAAVPEAQQAIVDADNKPDPSSPRDAAHLERERQNARARLQSALSALDTPRYWANYWRAGGGVLFYRCAYCHYDDQSIDAMVMHQRKFHPGPDDELGPKLYARDGTPIAEGN